MRALCFALAGLIGLAVAASAEPLAPTPPMGWNSWDAYGLTITEAQFRDNVAELAKLKPFGWSTAVIDEGWYMANPLGKDLKERDYQLDANGLLLPALSRFPSAANNAGLKPLGDLLHAQGMTFGVHVIRGIPKEAVEKNLAIAHSNFHATDAADTTDTCPWDDGNYGVKDNAAGQAYYDSMVKKYADWGVDFIKVDCIADHPYKPTEIRQIAAAIKNSGRPIILSLSPGPTNIAHAAEVASLAQMWRIADDTWDGWSFAPKDWPNGVLTGFKRLAEWHSYAKPGNWPDADMLPFGSLTPNPGWGEPRASRLTQDEAKTLFTLWAIARSPLILGGNLTKLDDITRAIITNKEVIAVNQTAFESYRSSSEESDVQAWMASTGTRENPTRYTALFNLGNEPKPLTMVVPWKWRALIDLWSGQRLTQDHAKIILPAHGSVIYRVE